MHKISIAVCAITMAMNAFGTDGADRDMEEVVVTASFRETTELTTPTSVTVISREIIEGRAATHFEDLIGAVPNLNYAGGTGRARFFQIRGIGERSQFSDPINPSVGVLIDNVDFSGNGSAATMMDIAQVEVLRGPQGTRYGAGALAGLVNIKSNDPGDTFAANLRAGGGQYGTRMLGATATGPLTDNISVRVAAENSRSDGFTKNAFLGRDDTAYRDETTVRTRLKVTGDAYRTDLVATFIDVDNGYDAFSLDNTRVTLSDEPGRDRHRSGSASVDHEWQMMDLIVKLIASVSRSESEYRYDEDWTWAGIHPDAYSSTDAYLRDRDTKSAELRVSSIPAAASTDWVAGLYILSANEDLSRRYTFLPSTFDSQYDYTTMAGFLQLDTALTSQLSATYGLRLERRDTRYQDSNAVGFSPDETMWGGNVSLQYQFEQGLMAYLSIARGYKAGGFNTDGTLPADLREFASEYLWELEVGAKGYAVDDRLQLRAAAFYDWRRNQQVKSSIVRVRNDGSTEFIDFQGNAATGKNVGLEIEANFAATENLALFLNMGLLNAQFVHFINEFGEDLSGRDQAHAPRYTLSLGADYVFARWSAGISVDAKDRFYFSDRHAAQSHAYALVNARVTWETDQFSVSLWGRNLANRDYFVRGFGSFGNDPRKGYIVEPYVQYGEPRMIGINFNYQID